MFLPRPEYVSDYPALLIELKGNQSAGAAIQQIKERQYPCALEAYTGDMLLVGISYDQKSKEHSCVIERFVKIKLGKNMTGILEIDVHGLRTEAAILAISAQVRQAGPGVYRVRVIHGYHGGTRIRSSIREEFGYGREAKVKRIEMGSNEGITELVLREY